MFYSQGEVTDVSMLQSLTVAALVAACCCLGVTPAEAGDLQPALTYTADPFVVVSGDAGHPATYAHVLTAGGTVKLSKHWSVAATGAWTAGQSLSERSVRDVQGVQGVFNSGDQLWLYQLEVTGSFDGGQVSIGRLSSGDAFGAIQPMSQFVNSAFSSNGGAISVNDPGRATSPASSWGVTGQLQPAQAVTLKAGLFLSDPDLFRGGVTFRRLAFRPGRGILGFVEADVGLGKGWSAGLGGWTDSADMPSLAGPLAQGNDGVYGFIDAALIPAPGAGETPRLEGFAMLQRAPRGDRSLEPTLFLGGLVLNGTIAGRDSDVLALGLQHGRINRLAGGGSETTWELNYRWTVDRRLSLRPDLQYVRSPAGTRRQVWVAGMQIEMSL